MTMPYRPGQTQRRCSCCGEMRWPPVCHTCDALLPPTSPTARDRELRQRLKDQIAAEFTPFSQEKAEVLLQRIADRLDGHTHDEAVARHPMPAGPECDCDLGCAICMPEQYPGATARQQPGSTPTDTTRE